jgi:hypothetical protein
VPPTDGRRSEKSSVNYDRSGCTLLLLLLLIHPRGNHLLWYTLPWPPIQTDHVRFLHTRVCTLHTVSWGLSTSLQTVDDRNLNSDIFFRLENFLKLIKTKIITLLEQKKVLRQIVVLQKLKTNYKMFEQPKIQETLAIEVLRDKSLKCKYI